MPGDPSTIEPTRCRICGGSVGEFLDLGRQPVSDSFVRPENAGREYFYRLAVGLCDTCSMVQLTDEVPREQMFHEDYPYRASGSAVMRAHFEAVAAELLEGRLRTADPFVVEIGSNDGAMLRAISKAGVRHLGVDPSSTVAETAREDGVDVRVDFFDEGTAREIRATHGPADVVFSANTLSHIAYIDSVFRGVDALLAPDGVLVVEDRDIGTILANNAFDQIYDEHFYLFSATSVARLAARFGFALVDAQSIPVHGGATRFTIARAGRAPTPRLREALEAEAAAGLADPATYAGFAGTVERISTDLVALLGDLRAQGRTVAGYGATAKSATLLNYCGIGPSLVAGIYDNTPGKQGRLSPGMHIPVWHADTFTEPYPDFVVLFAWNHAEEIISRETGFRDAGGRWVLYVPETHLV